jgi:EcsC protein family
MRSEHLPGSRIRKTPAELAAGLENSMSLSELDRQVLTAALRRLEGRSFAGRMAALAGKPVGLASRALPKPTSTIIAKATARALASALDIALFSLRSGPPGQERLSRGRVVHSALACASGAIGGAFGLTALTIELPVSTAIMLRAIAAIAQQQGEDLADPRTGLACLEVFALGAAAVKGGTPEGDYFAIRAQLAPSALEVADLAIDKTAVCESTPVVVRFVSKIAARFGVVVSQKLMVQAVAAIGAVGGAAVNLAFIEHFQNLAQGHFAIRRLERVYGADAVRAEYDRVKSDLSAVKPNPRRPDLNAQAASGPATEAGERLPTRGGRDYLGPMSGRSGNA